MKLYTEEQVMKILFTTKQWGNLSNDYLIATVTPIEIPSDRDIEIAANGNQEHYEGAMWLKYKYLIKTKDR